MTDQLIIASFAAGLLPMAIFLVYYGVKTRWYETLTGVVMFAMSATLTVTYSISLLTLSFPAYWRAEHGEWVRIIVRFVLAGVSWSLLWLLLWAQRNGERRRRNEKGDTQLFREENEK